MPKHDDEGDMPLYRAYTLTDDDHILDAPKVITCDSDQEAVQTAEQLINGHDVELWNGARLVTRIKSTDAK